MTLETLACLFGLLSCSTQRKARRKIRPSDVREMPLHWQPRLLPRRKRRQKPKQVLVLVLVLVVREASTLVPTGDFSIDASVDCAAAVERRATSHRRMLLFLLFLVLLLLGEDRQLLAVGVRIMRSPHCRCRGRSLGRRILHR